MKDFLKIPVCLVCMFLLFANPGQAQNQDFYFGNDLSYVNQMEDCGADYKYQGQSTDPYQIFADQGTNLVRVRLWVNPSWWQAPLQQPEGVKPVYSNLEDVKETIRRARDNGMEVLLDFHYSDFWADPGRQQVPKHWVDIADDVEVLADSVYEYTSDVLTELDAEGLMPNLVQVGNENNSGMMFHIPEEDGFETAGRVPNSNNWSRHAQLFNAGIQAVRDVGETASIDPKIALHFAGLNGLQWWFGNIINNGVTDFDIIGFSYYYAWHDASIPELENIVAGLVEDYPNREVMVLETGYLWSDDMGGIIDEPSPNYLPVIPEKQLEYMTDYTRAVIRAGGSGVIFWEPAWVDTPCRTPWITGSSHTHVAFFTPGDYNFMDNGGGRWMNPEFYKNPEAPKATFKVDMSGQEVSEEGMYITGSFTVEEEGGDWQLLPMADERDGIYSYYTYINEADSGAYYFVNGNSWDARETVPETCATMWDTDRGYTMPGEDTLFDFKWGSCEAIYASGEVEVTFKVDMTDAGVDYSNGVYVTGTFTADEGGGNWSIIPMTEQQEGIFSYQTELEIGDSGAYYFLSGNDWNARETVPDACADMYDSDRGYNITEDDTVFSFKWGSCEAITVSNEHQGQLPRDFQLQQNYPNPFNPSTLISYQLAVNSTVELTVYDALGREVAGLVNGQRKAAGEHTAVFDASNLSSGLYIYRLQAGEFVETRKMMLVK
ncbi:glycosyl hydrolase 53 family protein [Gracilimonas mengyeensis]|uniref:Arabinogalactan endo-beta-1,4-galactanase n=1 Tax=Gracilimonas mengyeensis TaxID=1302730 RepID=A0A521BSP1_9BACT|nr:glycosyl hydrolase 53 family protein [Gracilimonas mengyeensis]SMO50075.1 arabinogalactan endo-1,4-beta-galactosidase [Gracilimonas mengyeensis]